MKAVRAFGLMWLVAAMVAQSPPPADSQAKTIIIHAASLIDGTSAQPKRNQTIVVRGNRIVSVGEETSEVAFAEAQVINLGSATVLPGLIDTHTHIFLQGEDPAEGGYDAHLPRMFVVTRAISTTGGYPLEGYAPEVVVPKGAQLIDGPVEARKAAREQLDNGADRLKVYMTHRSWLDDKGNLVSQPTLTVEELKAIVDEAHG